MLDRLISWSPKQYRQTLCSFTIYWFCFCSYYIRGRFLCVCNAFGILSDVWLIVVFVILSAGWLIGVILDEGWWPRVRWMRHHQSQPRLTISAYGAYDEPISIADDGRHGSNQGSKRVLCHHLALLLSLPLLSRHLGSPRHG